jgi:hypothetical protein
MPEPTRTEQRTSAAAKVLEARALLIGAAHELDGLGATAHQNAMVTIAAADDTMDAIVAAEQLDREIEQMEAAA